MALPSREGAQGGGVWWSGVFDFRAFGKISDGVSGRAFLAAHPSEI